MNQLLNLRKKTVLAVFASLTAAFFFLSACDAAATAAPEPPSPAGRWEYLNWIGSGLLPERLNDVTGVIEFDIDTRDLEFLEDGTGWKTSHNEDEEAYFFTWFIDEGSGLLIIEETIWDMIYEIDISPNDHFGYVLELSDNNESFSLNRFYRLVE
ncbi:MAG: hypothetical protein FWE24_08380 [Defluviitaleaceae bacterium]|nr:hypothetical protein [Defluviitaleaceae bacterium]